MSESFKIAWKPSDHGLTYLDPSNNLKTIRSEDHELSVISFSLVNASAHTGTRSAVELLNSICYSHSHHHHKCA